MTKKKEKGYTSLVGVKWTQESLLICLHDMYERYHTELLNNKKISEHEKMKKLVHMNIQFLWIFDPIFRYGVTVKKK